MVDLGTLGGTFSSAADVSADGEVVVGQSYKAGDTVFHAFRWTQGTMTDLGTLGGNFSQANAISADGEVVVGFSHTVPDDVVSHAFRWHAGKMQDLGTLGGTNSVALDVSATGSVVVGHAKIQGDGATHAFLWEDGAIRNLGTLGGADSLALAVSADGDVVVGTSQITNSSAFQAFRWTANGGLQKVTDWLLDAGVSVPYGWDLMSATDVNANGNVLVGFGTYSDSPFSFNPPQKAWLARVGPEGNGLMTDIPAYNASVVEAGARGVHAGVGQPNLALFGAHHRTLLDSGLTRSDSSGCGWITLDTAGDEDTDTRAEIVEVGACKDIGAARIGLGVGQDWSSQDWALGGSAKLNGQHLVAEVDYRFQGGLEGSLLAYHGRFSTNLQRHYLNGASVDTSRGRPDAQSNALRLRLDWRDAALWGRFGISPYAAYAWFQTRLDAYTEIGGGFPALFTEREWEVNDLRLGIVGKNQLDTATDLHLGVEFAHRFEKGTNGVNGTVIGLWDFSLPGERIQQDWARAFIDVDRRLSDTLVATFGASASSSGGDATWALTAGLRSRF